MKEYPINFAISAIHEKFADTYNNAVNFINTPLYNQCLKIIGNTFALGEIGLQNDSGIPPVQTLLSILDEYVDEPKELSNYDSVCIGELMAFVFKQVLGYKGQKEHVPIKDNFGVKTAAFYYDRQEFEIL